MRLSVCLRVSVAGLFVFVYLCASLCLCNGLGPDSVFEGRKQRGLVACLEDLQICTWVLFNVLEVINAMRGGRSMYQGCNGLPQGPRVAAVGYRTRAGKDL